MYKQKLNLAILFILFSALVFAIPATAYDEGSGSSTTTGGSFTVTVAKTGAPPAGMGIVGSFPPGILCPGTCSASFPEGSKVYLTAFNISYYMEFTKWGGDCFGVQRMDSCLLIMNSDKNVYVRFYPTKRRIDVKYWFREDRGNIFHVLSDNFFFPVRDDIAPKPKRENASSERVSGMDATVVLTNNSTRSVDIGLIAGADPLDKPFEIFDDTCSDTTLPPYQECSFIINYDPVDNVLYKDTFDIPSSDPNFPEWTLTVREGEEDESGN